MFETLFGLGSPIIFSGEKWAADPVPRRIGTTGMFTLTKTKVAAE